MLKHDVWASPERVTHYLNATDWWEVWLLLGAQNSANGQLRASAQTRRQMGEPVGQRELPWPLESHAMRDWRVVHWTIRLLFLQENTVFKMMFHNTDFCKILLNNALVFGEKICFDHLP